MSISLPLYTGSIFSGGEIGIFSKSLSPFQGVIDEIFTPNPFRLEAFKGTTSLHCGYLQG